MIKEMFEPQINEYGEKGYYINEYDLEQLAIRTKKQEKAYEERIRREDSRQQNKFTNTNMNSIDYISEHLTNAQIGYLMMLESYIDYDGKLIFSQKNKTPMQTKDLLKVLGLRTKDSTFHDFKKKCLEHEILIENKNEKALFINRKFIFKGAFKGMGMDVVSTITKEAKKMNSNLKPTDLAILYKLKKYVHVDSMALVWNPQETNLYKIKTLKAKDLPEILGVSKGYIYQRLPQLVHDGEYLIAKVQVGKSKKYMLNPKIYFRGDYKTVQDNITSHCNNVFFMDN
ncbi:hypothetical protein CQZ91_21615 [Bacillus cereus]|uniref:hypothetical protein n=1 Tax=Bacillus cereus TaxID=1396 RepID=UPI000CFD2C36|nr:hypothetical protein [Bacillus cereus]MDA1977625.1 hypothetical protein [Bacillus cereus]PRC96580.1 hypothetical protein CQZ92_21510 [Bacillus cereus]PRD02467.1 hypothetical protein CQZ91_21615 [Bacillus cereus]